MAGGVRLGGFGFQVRLVLVLLALFLATLDLMNLRLLGNARDALAQTERRRVEAEARALLERLPAGAAPADLRRAAMKAGFEEWSVLDRAGRPGPGIPSRLAALGDDARAALLAGRTVFADLDPPGGGEGALLAAYLPRLGADGRPESIVLARAPVPELGRLESRLRLLWAVQAAGLLLIVAVSLLFANWISRPFRRLAAAVGESGIEAPAVREDPDALVGAFRTVAAKLREQEEALSGLDVAGGLGDLRRFASAAAGMTTGVLVVDRELRVAGANPAAAALLRGAPAGERLAEVAGAVPGLAALVERCLDQGRGVSREVLDTRGEDGRAGHLGVAISPAPAPSGRPAGALVLMTDLTEIRQVQAQVRLRESLAQVGQLSAGIAHEFRNALATILGYARMLEKQPEPRVSGPAREILREVASVRTAVDEFLLYARPPEPVRSEVEVGDLVRACAAAAPAGLSVEVAGEFGTVLADEGLLRRAFANLLQNAADMGAEAGRPVTVRIAGRRLGGALQVDVEDDGPGIPPDRRAQVFVPFYTTRSRGTGLGLALVQRTVVDLGGTVEAGEGPRGGALFRIRLPRTA